MNRVANRFALGAVLTLAGALAAPAGAQMADLRSQPLPGQPAQAQAQQPTGPLPTMKFDRTEHNFGTIFDDQSQTTMLHFWNEGPGVLEIREWRGSCSCTVGTLHKEGEDPDRPAGTPDEHGMLPVVRYQPGERGWLEINYDPHGKAGIQAQTVAFTINDPTNAVRVFRISANVIPVVRVEPAIANFNAVTKGVGGSMEVFVTGRTDDFEVVEATFAGNEFVSVQIHETVDLLLNEHGQWVPAEEVEGDADDVAHLGDDAALKAEGGEQPEDDAHAGHDHDHAHEGATPSDADMQPILEDAGPQRLRRTRLTVTVSPEAQPGRLYGSITVRTNDPRREIVSVVVAGEVVGDVAVTPRAIAFGIIPPETVVERRVQLISRAGLGFRIDNVEVISNLPETHRMLTQIDPITTGPNQGYILTVRTRVPASLAQFQGEIRLHTTLQGEETITIPFFGHVQGIR